MGTTHRLVAVFSAMLTLILTLFMLVNFSKERRISKLAPVFSAAVSLLMLPVFIVLGGARVNLRLGVSLLAVGLCVGFLRGISTKLYYRDGRVMGRNSSLFLLGWGGSLVLAQLLNMGGSALLSSIGLVPVFFSTGTQLGMNANIFVRRLNMESPSSGSAVEAAQLGLPEQARPRSRPSSLPERERTASLGPVGLSETDTQLTSPVWHEGECDSSIR